MAALPAPATRVKLGRNDPCPSGAGVKIKKCLIAHPVLSLDAPIGAIWWVCDRWQATAPAPVDLLLALPFAGKPDAAKLAVVEHALWEMPLDAVPWDAVLRNLAKAGRADVPGLLARILDRIGTADPARVWKVCEAALALAPEHGPELLRAAAAAYAGLAEDPLDPAPVRSLGEALLRESWAAEAEALKARFHRLLATPDAPTAPKTAPSEAPAAPPAPVPVHADPETARATELREAFGKLPQPSPADVDALVADLLALPADKAAWDLAFPVLATPGHPDPAGLYQRIVREARPGPDGLARLHAAAAETLVRRGQPEYLPEIAEVFPSTDVSAESLGALGRLVDELMFQDLIEEAITLCQRFLPLALANAALDRRLPRQLAWRILQLRIARRVAAASPDPLDLESLAALLREGLDEFVTPEAALRAARTLLVPAPEPGWARDRLNAWPSAKAAPEEIERLELVYLGTQIWIVREARQFEKLSPALAWLGLDAIRRMLDLETQRKRNRPVNLLDYLDIRHLEGRISRACQGPSGPRRSQTGAMTRTLDAVIRFASRRALLPEYQAEPLEVHLLELLDRFERVP